MTVFSGTFIVREMMNSWRKNLKYHFESKKGQKCLLIAWGYMGKASPPNTIFACPNHFHRIRQHVQNEQHPSLPVQRGLDQFSSTSCRLCHPMAFPFHNHSGPILDPFRTHLHQPLLNANDKFSLRNPSMALILFVQACYVRWAIPLLVQSTRS